MTKRKIEETMAAFDETQDALKTLMEMGFEETEAKAALEAIPDPKTADAALEYLVNQGDKSDDKDGSEEQEVKVAKSYRCVETGKLFRTMQDAQLYAERTGRSNFEESDVEVPPLTKEEKEAKVAQLREKIAAKRKERAEMEKIEERERELNRRKGGQEMAAIRKEHEQMQMQREAELRKKEKEAFKAERERLRLELARDKAERAADAARRKGETPEQVKQAYDDAYDHALGKGKPSEAMKKKQNLSASSQMDAAIKDLLTYRAGGDGLRAINTLKKMVANLVQNPEEPKFRQVKLTNEAFKKRVASLHGGVAFLKACGFQKKDIEQVLALEDDEFDLERLKTGLGKLEKAIADENN